MRAYSFNKYSNNDLKIINRKNTNNFNMKSMNINMVNIKKNKFDEDFKSDISSESNEEPILYTKKSITNKNNIKLRSASVDNQNIKKDLNKNINRSINNFSYAKSLVLNNIKDKNIENPRNVNNIDINLAGKTFTSFYLNQKSNNNNNKQKNSNNNVINTYNRFNSTNVLFNNFRGGNDNKKNKDERNNFYAVKKPLEKQKQIYRKRKPTEEVKPIILKETNEINALRNISNREEEEKTITINNTDNTILDENEESIGRNIPH